MPTVVRDRYILTMSIKQQQRFVQYVKKGPGCWLWTGPRTGSGYGNMCVGQGGKLISVRAQRVLLVWRLGRPSPLFANHSCHNPLCVRPGPGHVYLGTHQQNQWDSIAAKTHTSQTRDHAKMKSCVLTAKKAIKIYNLHHIKHWPVGRIAEHMKLDHGLCAHVIAGNSWAKYTGAKKGYRLPGVIWRKNKVVGEAQGMSKLTNKKVRKIREQAKKGMMLKDIAKEHGVGVPCISMVVNRKTWRHV